MKVIILLGLLQELNAKWPKHVNYVTKSTCPRRTLLSLRLDHAAWRPIYRAVKSTYCAKPSWQSPVLLPLVTSITSQAQVKLLFPMSPDFSYPNLIPVLCPWLRCTVLWVQEHLFVTIVVFFSKPSYKKKKEKNSYIVFCI
jgi:hypothetical protein